MYDSHFTNLIIRGTLQKFSNRFSVTFDEKAVKKKQECGFSSCVEK
jgi:hypothetical protein